MMRKCPVQTDRPPEGRPWFAGLTEEPAPGSHLTTGRLGYTHHGIYAGDGRVIHYAGLHHGLAAAPVEECSIEDFARGHAVDLVVHESCCFAREEAVRRARSRLGESRYRILTNNCEHFCSWCLTGDARSAQVERALAALVRAFARMVGSAAGTAVGQH
jgi:hypothetical protein